MLSSNCRPVLGPGLCENPSFVAVVFGLMAFEEHLAVRHWAWQYFDFPHYMGHAYV